MGGYRNNRGVRAWVSTGVKLAAPLLLAGASLYALKLLAAQPGYSAEEMSATLARAGAWGPVLFVLASALRPLVLLPAQVFAAAAGAMWGAVAGSGIAIAGSWLSTIVVIGLGGRLLRRPLARWCGSRRAEIEHVARRHDFLYGVVMALNPLLPTDLAIATAAGAGARTSRLLAGALVGAVPQTITTAMFGGALVKSQPFVIVLSSIGMAVSLVGGAWIGRSMWRSLRPAKQRLVVQPQPIPVPEPARVD